MSLLNNISAFSPHASADNTIHINRFTFYLQCTWLTFRPYTYLVMHLKILAFIYSVIVWYKFLPFQIQTTDMFSLSLSFSLSNLKYKSLKSLSKYMYITWCYTQTEYSWEMEPTSCCCVFMWESNDYALRDKLADIHWINHTLHLKLHMYKNVFRLK